MIDAMKFWFAKALVDLLIAVGIILVLVAAFIAVEVRNQRRSAKAAQKTSEGGSR